MIYSSGCKINLGLNIIGRRSDGYHDIETVMYPISGIEDLIEIVECENYEFSSSGITVDCPTDKNLCTKAFRLMQNQFGIGNVKIHLHKNIPFGAGLGGGSANATAVIKALNDIFGLNLSIAELENLSAQIGSDTPFFVRNTPQIATGRGEILTPIDLSLSGLWIAIVKPDIAVSTAEAYAGITPRKPIKELRTTIKMPIKAWTENLVNDFEASVFKNHASLNEIKQGMYKKGAIYVAMSGSGSAIFGLFESEPDLEHKGLIIKTKL